MEDKIKKFIVRTDRAGVFYGHVAGLERDLSRVHMTNVRKIWYWSGACAVEELAINGTTEPDECQLTVSVPDMVIAAPIQILPVSEKAQKILDGIKEWRRG